MAAGGRRPSQSQLSHTYSPASLHRSVSQLLNLYDKKTFDESPWDAIIHNHRSPGRGLVRAPAPLGCCCASPARDLSVLLESQKRSKCPRFLWIQPKGLEGHGQRLDPQNSASVLLSSRVAGDHTLLLRDARDPCPSLYGFH